MRIFFLTSFLKIISLYHILSEQNESGVFFKPKLRTIKKANTVNQIVSSDNSKIYIGGFRGFFCCVVVIDWFVGWLVGFINELFLDLFLDIYPGPRVAYNVLKSSSSFFKRMLIYHLYCCFVFQIQWLFLIMINY